MDIYPNNTEKVNKGTLIHRNFEVHIRFGNVAYYIKPHLVTQQLE